MRAREVTRTAAAGARRGLAPLAGAFGLVAGLAACAEDRERLDVPRLTLTVDQQAVLRGNDLQGRVTAVDASGLTYLRVWALVEDSIISQYPPGVGAGTLFGNDSVSYRFVLHISCAAPDGSPVEIQARTLDNQGFDVTRYDTITARGACPGSGSAARAR